MKAERAVKAGARLPDFVGYQGDVEAALAKASAAVVGAGSIGLVATCHLARAGIGTLHIVDRGTLKAASVLTHPIQPEAVGRPKAEYAGEVATAIAPESCIVVHQGSFEDLPVDAFDCQILIEAVDNLETEIEVSQRCLNLGIPLLQASVYGNALVAQVRTFTGGENGEGPCSACLFGTNEWGQVSRESLYSCDGSTAERGRSLAPTRSLASLCSLAAELAVHRAIRHLLGLGAPLTDQILEYRGYSDTLVSSKICAKADCPVEHSRWKILPRGAARTVGEVLRQSGLAAPATVSVDGAVFVDEAVCGGGTWQTVGCFASPQATLGPCGHCGGPLAASPFHSYAEVAADQQLANVLIPPENAVVVRSHNGETALLTARRSHAS